MPNEEVYIDIVANTDPFLAKWSKVVSETLHKEKIKNAKILADALATSSKRVEKLTKDEVALMRYIERLHDQESKSRERREQAVAKMKAKEQAAAQKAIDRAAKDSARARDRIEADLARKQKARLRQHANLIKASTGGIGGLMGGMGGGLISGLASTGAGVPIAIITAAIVTLTKMVTAAVSAITKLGTAVLQIAWDAMASAIRLVISAITTLVSSVVQLTGVIVSKLIAAFDRLKTVATLTTLAVGAALSYAVQKLLKYSFQVEAIESLFRFTFRGMTKEVFDWSETTGKALGRQGTMLRGYTAKMFNMVYASGVAEDMAAKLAKNIVLLSQDLSSFYNLDPEQAFQAMASAIAGENEPLKRLGIFIRDNQVSTKAYTLGLAKQKGQLSAAAKVMATYSMMMEQTKIQQGNLAATQIEAANQLRRYKAILLDIAKVLGNAVQPAFKTAMSIILPFTKKVYEYLAKNAEHITKGISAIFDSVLRVIIAAASIGLALFGISIESMGKTLEGFAQSIPSKTEEGFRWFIGKIYELIHAGFRLSGIYFEVTQKISKAWAAMVLSIKQYDFSPMIERVLEGVKAMAGAFEYVYPRIKLFAELMLTGVGGSLEIIRHQILSLIAPFKILGLAMEGDFKGAAKAYLNIPLEMGKSKAAYITTNLKSIKTLIDGAAAATISWDDAMKKGGASIDNTLAKMKEAIKDPKSNFSKAMDAIHDTWKDIQKTVQSGASKGDRAYERFLAKAAANMMVLQESISKLMGTDEGLAKDGKELYEQGLEKFFKSALKDSDALNESVGSQAGTLTSLRGIWEQAQKSAFRSNSKMGASGSDKDPVAEKIDTQTEVAEKQLLELRELKNGMKVLINNGITGGQVKSIGLFA